MLEGVLRGLDGVDLRGKLLVSVVASAPTALIERALGAPVPVVRAMPNTPCLRKAGMTAVCAGSRARTEHLRVAEAIFRSVGRCIAVEEEHMDAVTGLSASGPAFIYIVIESLAEAGVKVGLPRRTATELAAQTVLGSARMVLETGAHPALLKDMVTTPAGCTMDGILELEDGGLRVTLIKAVVRATQRAKELIDETALRDSAADRGSRRRRAGAEGVGGGWGGIAAADEGRGRRGVLKANRGA
jgi:pyrroline-5-carboxylate reductase